MPRLRLSIAAASVRDSGADARSAPSGLSNGCSTIAMDLLGDKVAIILAAKALAIDPKSVYSMAVKGMCSRVAGDYEGAINWQRRALENDGYAKDEN
jgi:hypothetical protein